MKGLRYPPLHVTEFCGEMQGKFKVGFARLINHENMAARSGYFRSYHLPMLSAKQNDSQSEEINAIDESRAENRPVPVQEAEIRWKKVSLVGRYICYA